MRHTHAKFELGRWYVVHVCELVKCILFLHCTTYILQLHTNYSTAPPHPYPTLIIMRKRLDEQDNTTTRSDMIPSPCQIICHTSIHDPWSMDNRQYWKLTFLTKNGGHWLLHDLPSNSAWVSCKTPGWPVTVKNSQSQSSSFLKWKTSFRSFFRKNLVDWILDSLNIFIHCRLSYCVHHFKSIFF